MTGRNFVAALFNQARQEFLQGAYQQALATVDRASACEGETPDALILRASIHEHLGAHLEAARCYEAAMAARPDMRRTLGLRAVSHYFEAGETRQALDLLISLDRLFPRNIDIVHSICSLYREAGDYSRALPFALTLAEIGKSFDNWMNAGMVLIGLDRLEDAMPLVAAAFGARPEDRLVLTEYFWCALGLCDFPLAEDLQARLEAAYATDGEKLDIRETVFRSLQWSGDEAYHVLSAINTARQRVGAFAARRPYRPKPNRRLRIGYLSSDFHEHATLALFAGVLEAHDRSQFEVFGICHTRTKDRNGPLNCFNVFPDGKPVPTFPGNTLRDRFLNAVDHFVDILDLDDDAAARTIAALDLDILIDLKGFTHNNRLGIFCRRPAPIQVTYLGFPGSVAGVGIDYAITDATVTPPSAQAFYAEKLFTLPHSYQANDDKRLVVERDGPRSRFGLPDEGIVFCSFNQPVKIRGAVFRTWMDVLKAVPGSVLWLIDMPAMAKANLGRAASLAGVQPERLIFAPKLPLDQHLQRLCHADLALDTGPYNGHTTTADALWAAVPVVTWKGTSFAGRVSQSLLQAVGLPQLVAEDLQGFGRLAAELAQDGNRLSHLRQHLIAARKTAPLFDTARFTRDFEATLKAIAADAALQSS
ncbi:O-linked N-acetylglucosamine transferase, SPINDLY family protein [Rhizobium paknamense]|uniref:protein O-GlcNAc transferase n=1 Tax=Rhizobium paknamense TaxID=1206817 RepID=A0ABU0IA38_9HYPH|nr:glycosyltransferase family 41 protein [Rhizobium paknamense]MDQ0455102.1 putative O-linked N-acetylglucosamine transferase (SPINDLY family) [Rhizobium paknamense]